MPFLDLPIIDYQLDSYENRLLLAGLRAKTPLDFVVNDLYVEWYYFAKIISSPEAHAVNTFFFSHPPILTQIAICNNRKN